MLSGMASMVDCIDSWSDFSCFTLAVMDSAVCVSVDTCSVTVVTAPDTPSMRPDRSSFTPSILSERLPRAAAMLPLSSVDVCSIRLPTVDVMADSDTSMAAFVYTTTLLRLTTLVLTWDFTTSSASPAFFRLDMAPDCRAAASPNSHVLEAGSLTSMTCFTTSSTSSRPMRAFRHGYQSSAVILLGSMPR